MSAEQFAGLDDTPALLQHVGAVLVQERAEREPHGRLVGRLDRKEAHRRVRKRIGAPVVERGARVKHVEINHARL